MMWDNFNNFEVILIISVISFFTITLFRPFRIYFEGGQYKKPTRIDGKIVIITGGSSGIGKQTAINLAKRGGKIYITSRDKNRGEIALNEIREKSGNKNIFLLILDLASMDSIREFSEKFHNLESKLDILINNAGIMNKKREITKDGFEKTFGVNHLGHFLLTNLLMDLLKSSAPSRIVTVSSSAHKIGKINKNDLQNEKSYSAWPVYGQSKLANILFTQELSKKLQGTGVTANTLHPGAVVTEILANMDFLTKCFFYPFKNFFFKTIESGAQTTIYAAVDPSLEKVSGKYFVDCKEASMSKAATCDELAKWLWNESEKLTSF